MLDFNIVFIDKTTIQFVDLSDYTGISVLDTSLSLYLPPIENTSVSNDIDLYSTTETGLPITTLGNNAVIDLNTLEQPFTLVDGVYRVLYKVILEGATETSVEHIFFKKIDLIACKKALIKDLITNPDSTKCKACEATFFDSVFASIEAEAIDDNYIEATQMAEYLKEQCKICNC